MTFAARCVFVGLIWPSFATSAFAAEAIFPTSREAEIGGKPVTLRLTGWAYRKVIGLKMYRIGGYCDASHSPADVDALAAADVAKQLVLVMERDIKQSILRKSFEQAFAVNDPEEEFPAQISTLLDHMTATTLAKGDRVTLTHLPGRGVECRIRDEEPIVVADAAFAHVVWNVYMGPKSVTAELRRGLGSQLPGGDKMSSDCDR